MNAASANKGDSASQASAMSSLGAKNNRFIHRKIHLFPVLKSIQGQKPYPAELIYMGMIWSAMQLFATVLNRHLNWGTGVGSSVVYITEAALIPIWDSGYFDFSFSVFFALYFVVVAAVMSYLGLTCAMLVKGPDHLSERTVTIFRLGTHFMATVLFEPFLHTLLGVTVCNNDDNLWLHPDESCWSAVHTVTVLVSILLGTIFLFVIKSVQEMVFEDDAFSPHPLARPHGILDAIYVLYQACRVVSFHVLLARDMHTVYLFIHMVCTFLFGVAYCVILPHYNETAQRLKAACFFATSHMFLILYVRARTPFDYHGAIALGTVPAAFYFGWRMGLYRRSGHLVRALDALLYDERPIRTECVFPRGMPFSERAFTNLRELEEDLLDADEGMPLPDSGVDGEVDGISDDSEEVLGSHFGISLPYVERVYTFADVEVATRYLFLFKRLCDLPPTGAMLAHAARIYLKGTMMFPSSVFLRIHYCAFMLIHAGKIQFSHLEVERVSAMPGTIAHQFMLYKLSLRIKAMLGIRDKTHLLNFNSANRLQKEVLMYMGEFWTRVMEPSVDFVSLAQLANDITDRRIKALALYKRVLLGGGMDQHILERFGTFCEYIMLDAVIANECFTDAKTMAEERRRRVSSRRGGGGKASNTQDLTTASYQQALVERFETLESKDQKGGNRTIEMLARNLNAVIGLLMIIVLGNVLLHILNTRTQSQHVDQMSAVGHARAYSVYCLHPLEALINFSGSTTDAAFGQLLETVELARQVFRNFHNSVTFGSHKSTFQPTRETIAETSLNADYFGTSTTTIPEPVAMSVWTLGNVIAAALEHLHRIAGTFMQNEEGRFDDTSISHHPSLYLLRANVMRTAVHYNITVRAVGDEWKYFVGVSLYSLIGLYVMFLLIIVLVYVLFLMNFRKIAMSKVQTLRLFTLIPQNTLQKMCTEAQQRIIQNERSENEEDERPGETLLTNSGTGGDVDPSLLDDDDDDDGPTDNSAPRPKKALIRNIKEAARAVIANQRLLMKKLTTTEARRASMVHKNTPVALLLQRQKQDDVQQINIAGDGVSPLGELTAGAEPDEPKSDEDEGEHNVETKEPVKPSAPRPTKQRRSVIPMQATVPSIKLFALVCFVVGMVGVVVLAGIAESRIVTVVDDAKELRDSVLLMRGFQDEHDTMMDAARRFVATGDSVFYSKYWDTQRNYKMFSSRFDMEVKFKKEDVRIARAYTAAKKIREREVIAMRLCLAKHGFTVLAEFPEIASATWSAPKVDYTARLDAFLAHSRMPTRMYTTDAEDLAMSPDDQFLLARTLLADDTCRNLAVDVDRNIDEARNKAIADEKNTMEVSLQWVYTAALVGLVLTCMCAVAALQIPHSYLRWVFVVLACGCIAVCATIVHYDSSSNDLVTAVQNVARDMHGGNALRRTTMEVQSFTQFGDVVRLHEYWNARSRDVLEHFQNYVLGATSDFSFESVQEVTRLQKQSAELEQLETTALVLAAKAFGVSSTQLQRAEGFQWNFAIEKNRVYTDSLYPGARRYTDDVSDSYRTVEQQKQIALETVHNRRHSALLEDTVGLAQSFGARMLEREIDLLDDRQTLLLSLMSVVIALSSVMLISGIVCSLYVVQYLMTTDTTGMSMMHQQLFAQHAHLCKVTLIIVAFFLSAAFGHGVYAVQHVHSAAGELDDSSARMWLVSLSSYYAHQITVPTSTSNVYESRVMLRRLVPDLMEARDDLYRSSSYAMGKSSQTDLLFGGSSPLTPSTTCLASEVPVEVKFNQWFLDIVALQDDTLTAQRAASIAAALDGQVEDLLRGLEASDAALTTSWKDSISESQLIQLVLLILTLLVLVGVYFSIFRPMIQQLIVEEEGTKMMLRMIPVHVQESVPEIADYLHSDSMDTNEMLKRNLKQSEKLLQNILPPAISRRLKSGEAVISDFHERVTSTMTDFVGFADFARGKSAVEIVEFLNEIFCLFDTVCDTFHIEKIKTIQQVYFFVSGLSVQSKADHALRAVEAALQFFELVAEHFQRHNVDTKQLMLRVGCHTGPAVAGVIGSRKICYDLWGDTINTSSRVQYNGVAGRIQVTDETFKDVAEYFCGVERPISAKGKGTITTYVITGRLKPSQYANGRKHKHRSM
eukprot:PhM_4_TR14127/c0_g1_i1/m.90855